MTQLLQTIEDCIATLRPLAGLDEPLNRASKMVLACLTSRHKLLVCGNGGSASDGIPLSVPRRPPALPGHFAHGQRRIHDRRL